MNKSSPQILLSVDSLPDLVATEERLTTFGVARSIDTFVVAKHVDFTVGYRVTRDTRFTGSNGDLINLGEGSWIYAGTAIAGTAGSSPWNFEYQSSEDSLFIQIAGRSAKFSSISNPESPVQFRKDVDRMPTLILVRREILIDSHDDDYGLRGRAGSFIQFS